VAWPAAELPLEWPIGASAEARADPLPPREWFVAVAFARAHQPRPGAPEIHTGLDLRLRRGGAGLEVPVYACGDGMVTASGAYPLWGDVVVIEHPLPGGRRLWSQYAHLDRRLVPAGKAVRRGERIGAIGAAGARLHFELRRSDLPPGYRPGLDRAAVLRHYLDPAAAIRSSASATGGPEALSGKGVLSACVWEVDRGDPDTLARRAAGLGLRFVMLRLGHGDRPLAANLSEERTSSTARALRSAGLSVWGWGAIAGANPAAEAALGLERVAALGLAGWAVEPIADYPADAAARFIDAWRTPGPADDPGPGSGGRLVPPAPPPLAVLSGGPSLPVATGEPAAGGGEPDLPAMRAAAARFAAGASVLMPRVARAGEIGLVAARIGSLGLPLVPVLALDGMAPVAGADPAAAAEDFLYHACACGCAGAALATWEWTQRSAAGFGALRALARGPWDPVPVPAFDSDRDMERDG